MNKTWNIPPANKSALSTPAQLATRLQTLIGRSFPLTRKPRTDGSNLRKLVAATLQKYPLPEPASEHGYEVAPKGVPKILREFIDTYIVTSGDVYNLQVWNRIPTSDSVHVRYFEGGHLSAKDVRFVLVPVDPVSETITSIVILTSEYIEARFGRFGKLTSKQQLIVGARQRNEILTRRLPVFVGVDTSTLDPLLTDNHVSPFDSIHDLPRSGRLFSLRLIGSEHHVDCWESQFRPTPRKTEVNC